VTVVGIGGRLLFGMLAGAVALGPGTTGGVGAPVDRRVVALPPVYPATPAGFLRVPDTRSAPVPLPVAPGRPPAVTAEGVGDAARAPAVPVAPRVWVPSRLEPVTGIDGHGRVASVLEYTPGRFAR
jgi:hypothetical protein